MKAFKAFLKPYEAPQGSEKIKMLSKFFLYVRDRGGKG